MGLNAIPDGRRIYLDANVFIYALEGYPRFVEILRELFARLDAGILHAVTSELTLAEVLVKPLLNNNTRLQIVYQEALQTSAALTLAPVSRTLLVEAARLRASHGALKLPDALHAATAQAYACHTFITNDQRFKTLPTLEVVLLSESG